MSYQRRKALNVVKDIASQVNFPSTWRGIGLAGYAHHCVEGVDRDNCHIAQPTAEQWLDVNSMGHEFVIDNYGRYSSCRIEIYNVDCDLTCWIDFPNKEVIAEVEGKLVTAPIVNDEMDLEFYIENLWDKLTRERDQKKASRLREDLKLRGVQS